MGELVGLSIQFSIGELPILANHCNGIRGSFHLGLKEMMDTRSLRIVYPMVILLHAKSSPFSF